MSAVELPLRLGSVIPFAFGLAALVAAALAQAAVRCGGVLPAARAELRLAALSGLPSVAGAVGAPGLLAVTPRLAGGPESRVASAACLIAPVGAGAAYAEFGRAALRAQALGDTLRGASGAVRCAFWETVGRNRFARGRQSELPRSEVEARLVVSLRSTGPLALIDRRDNPYTRTAVLPENHGSGWTCHPLH